MKKTPTILVTLSVVMTSLLPLSEATAGMGVNTLKADFVMIRKVAVLKEALSSRGRVMIGGKGKLRFETTHPSRSIIVINGEEGWLHYPELGVTKRFELSTDPVMRIMSEQLAALTKGDFTALKSMYSIVDKQSGTKSLTPIDPRIKKLFKILHVTLLDGNVISKVEMISANGDTTTLRFENPVLNAPLDPSFFEKPSAVTGAP
jgi:outer membrane lipoprotein-sorting protein